MIKTHQSSGSTVIKFSHWRQGKLEDQSTTNLKFKGSNPNLEDQSTTNQKFKGLNPAPANVKREKIAKLFFLNIYFTFNQKIQN